MSQKVKSSVGAKQVLLAKWICGGAVAVAIIVGLLVGLMDGKTVIANAVFAVAIVASFACMTTIHARHITRHAAACTKQAENHTDKRINDVQEHTDRRIDELRRMIKFDGIYDEVDQYLQNRGQAN